jgi:glucose/arabinose dehydrogenase
MATFAATSLVSAGGTAAEAPANNEVEVAAAALPEGFQEQVVFGGLTNPTSVEFAGDGRVFVAEKSGIVKVFDSLSDSTPDVFADLRTNVHNFWDRGLLGMALHPNFPATPYVYVLYTYDAAIGGTAPRWGVAGQTSDGCPNPPGATADGCVVSGRLSRLQAAGNQMTGPEQVLIEDWCQQYPSHSVGSLAFGADGALYVTSGDGASFNFADYGQDGSPVNPCGDPPAGVGGAQTPPTAEGGALRSQDLRTSGDPLGLDGTVLRVDPATGAGLPNNPMAGSADANARRVIATGLRNPFRMTIRPGTNEVWLGDVGWNTFEELNRVPNPTDATVENFGWPCYEGAGRQSGYDSLNLNICENLYAAGAGAHAAPYYAYNHSEKVVAGETCPMGSSSVAGVEFYEGGNYPDAYDGAMFFADYSRDCIWVMFQQGGQPAPSTRQTFFPGAANPVELKIGPSGDLFYVDFEGSVRRMDGGPPNETRVTGRPRPATETRSR